MGTLRVEGKVWRARNWSRDAGAGSIHDDATAAQLGFRGGTVAGSIHMDQFAALLAQLYGPVWFERGALSLYFTNATTDGEAVRVVAEQPDARACDIAVAMLRDDGMRVCEGTASLYDHRRSALARRDLKPVDPKSLRILAALAPGQSLGEIELGFDVERFQERLARGLVSDPLPEYSGPSRWGAPIAPPSLVVELLWGAPMRGLGAAIGAAGGVGLFGAIEVAHHNGPVFQDRRYTVTASVVAVSESPKTEALWFDSRAYDAGRLVATQRMMLRFMKASSPLYR